MSEEQLGKILQKLDELTNAFKTHSDAMSDVKTDLNILKGEHISFREELTTLQKQMTDISVLSPTAFVQKVMESVSGHSSMRPAEEEADPPRPSAHSTPSSSKSPSEATGQCELNRRDTSAPKKTCTNTAQSLPPREPQAPPVYREQPEVDEKLMRRPALAPAEYDGKVPWSRYEVHFDAVSRANGWICGIKAIYLAAHLRGTALAYYETLSPSIRENYEKVSEAFRIRFSTDHQQSVSHIQLRARTQKGNENFAEYATDLQRLTYLTFADCPESARDRIALEQFLDGILDSDVQERVRDSAPTSLQAALQTAVRIEANHRATRAARRSIRVAATSTTNGNNRRQRSGRPLDVPVVEQPETRTCALPTTGNESELA